MDGIPEVFTLNDFCFCREHGHELCNKCFMDHRMTNNAQGTVAQDLQRKLGGDGDFLKRPPLSAFEYGAIPCGTKADRYKCTKHNKVDCKTCFDWVKHIVALSKKKTRGLVDDRELLFRFLSSMGVDIPSTYNISDIELEKKFKLALEYAQDLKNVPTLPVNPDSYPLWKVAELERSIYEAMNRVSLFESLTYRGDSGSLIRPPDNVSIHVRTLIMTIAHTFQNGMRIWLLQDKKQTEATCIRAIDGYRVAEDFPLITLLYETGSESTPIHTLPAYVTSTMKEDKSIPTMECEVEEQIFLRKLLFCNSTKLSPEYAPQRRPFEESFKLSFLAPTGPLSTEARGKLTKDTGCVVCGKKTVNKCSQCKTASYCSKECQRAHWKTHKPVCRSLRPETWDEFEFVMNEFGGQKMFTFHLDNRGALNSRQTNGPDDGPPPNVHGSEPFVVKLQRPMGDPEVMMVNARMGVSLGMIFIYDRQRSFKAQLAQPKASQVYVKALETILKDRTSGGLKAYRWAKRTGDWKLSVCFDIEPEPTPTW